MRPATAAFGSLHLAGLDRQLRRAPRQARVERLARQVGAAFQRQRLMAALAGDFGKQVFVKQLVAKLDVGQRRRGFDLRLDCRCRRDRLRLLRNLRTGRQQQSADGQVFE